MIERGREYHKITKKIKEEPERAAVELGVFARNNPRSVYGKLALSRLEKELHAEVLRSGGETHPMPAS